MLRIGLAYLLMNPAAFPMPDRSPPPKFFIKSRNPILDGKKVLPRVDSDKPVLLSFDVED
jgi:hypothetical protein